ncbi:translocation/assembly module TamB domain-containing protein [Flavobacterium sp. I3-2]|uniref:translocation/assembly module TamB domain-containing protein n=1 Tax=Flavobacterium sp. I3-2 TaxID=2748319 RepID=UPI0021049D0F|nr:translocation/assembly module TamB domain-containing protein [Flavobacterium sp. I3-2]
MLLIIAVSVALTTPVVQTAIAQFASKKINEAFNLNTSIGMVAIRIDGNVILKNVSVNDDHENTLGDIGKLHTNILDFKKLINGQLFFGSTKVEQLDFHIHTYKGDTLSNLDKFIAVFDDGKPGSGKFLMKINHIEVKNGSFSITDDNNKNPKSLDFTNLNGALDNLLIKGPNISANITNLAFDDHHGFQVKDLKTDFSMTKTSMQIANLNLETKESELKGSIQMNYEVGDLKYFVDKVNLEIDIEKSILATNELHNFYSEFGKDKKLYLKTKLKGTLNNFKLSNTNLTDNLNSQIRGNFELINLLDKEKEFKISTQLDRLYISRENAVSLLPNVLGKSLPDQLTALGMIDLNGTIQYSNFTLDADFKAISNLGKAVAKISMEKLNQPKLATYFGEINLENFNIGNLISQQNIGSTTLNLIVDGKGFDAESLDTNVSGDIESFAFNNYFFKNISIDGNLKWPQYQGSLISKDANALVDFDGTIDFSEKAKAYDFKLDVEHIDLHALKLVKDSISEFKGNIVLNATGNSVDDFAGTLQVENAFYQNSQEEFYFDNFELKSSFDDEGVRTIEMNSPDILNGYVRGKYQLKQVKDIIENALGSIYTNYKPNKLNEGQFMEFDFDINSKIVEIFVPNIEISENTKVKGNINADDGEFKFNLNSPFVNFAKNSLKTIDVTIDNKNPLFNTYITIDSIQIPNYDITDFNFLNITQNDTLFARTEFKGGKEAKDYYNLNLYYTIDEGNKSIVGLQKSEVNFKNSLWYLNEKDDSSNRIVFNKKLTDFNVEEISLSHNEQMVKLNGVMRDSTYKDLNLTFDKVDLAKVTPDLNNLSFAGLVNGNISFIQENKVFKPTSHLTIDNLTVNDILLGLFSFDVKGDESLRNFKVHSTIENENVESFFLNGNINVLKNTSNLDLEAGFVDFDLKSIAPLLSSIMADVRGDASGRVAIKGTHKKPVIDGRLYLKNSGMRPVFTGVDYLFEENTTLDVTESKFILRNANIIDSKYQTKGVVNGTIAHKGFQDWNLNVRLSSNNLLALDTKYIEGTPYYGKAFIDGFATIVGPAEALHIKIEAKSEKGTAIKIPLGDSSGVGDNNFIHFLSPEEKRNRELGIVEQNSINQFGGIQLDFEFEITPDAEIEIILDPVTGHAMKGKGAGFITMQINTLGSFNMWGDFQVYEGYYNFKYGVLIDKKFTVKKYGTIRWDGDPLNAALDLSAIYKTQANPAIIIENSAINRKIDTDVAIVLTGNLSNPNIDFEINFPNISSTIKSEIEYKLADKDTRETQAMALLATGGFITSNTDTSVVYGSLFERASSLFDDLFSDEDSKVKIGMTYSQSARNPLADDDAARVGVTLQTQISDRIFVNGKLGVPVGGAEDNVIIGDVEIQLLLNEDGTLRGRVFNRENDINYIGEGIGYTQGVGLTYEVGFDTFKELIRKIMIRADKRAKEKALEQNNKKKEEQIPDDDYGVDFLKFQENRREEQSDSHEPPVNKEK